MGESLLERYGRVRLTKVVSAFYSDVLRSTRLGHFFDDVPISDLVEHQTMFLAAVMGGPSAFSPSQIEEAHHGLAIGNQDFEEMLGLLEVNLIKFKIDPDDAAKVLAGYRELQRQVVNHPGNDP